MPHQGVKKPTKAHCAPLKEVQKNKETSIDPNWDLAPLVIRKKDETVCKRVKTEQKQKQNKEKEKDEDGCDVCGS